jgi:hypothetical protein
MLHNLIESCYTICCTIHHKGKLTMPVAIHTKYLGPTDKTDARVRATAWRGNGSRSTVIVPFDHAASDAHAVAARALRDKYFPGEPLMLAGSTLDGKGNIYAINPLEA